jgi:signal transduction histidine kinase
MNHQTNNTAKVDILIVDDTPDNIRVLSTMLLEQGYGVRKALNGKMALVAAHAKAPDLILLDITMPDMNGYEVCQRLKEQAQTSTIPIIFLSALDGTTDKVKAFQVGGADYITKPFQFEEVMARIQTQLTVRSLQMQLQAQNKELQDSLHDLKNAQSRLVQQEKMIGLGQLTAGIAHEINNPISFIFGNLEPAWNYIKDLTHLIQLYQREYPDPTIAIQEATEEIDLEFLIPDLHKLMRSMQNGAERIQSIILALRIFSRLDESDIKPVDLHDGLDSTLLLLKHRLQQKEKSLDIKVVKTYGKIPSITCHARQLNQVFFNLLNNAIDALELAYAPSELALSSASQPRHSLRERPQSTPTIWISTECIDSEMIKVQIRDNGVGIADELRDRIFDPFYTTKQIGTGVGLGLSISYQIVVEQHKGQLMCHSQLEQGAEFVIKIPVQRS